MPMDATLAVAGWVIAASVSAFSAIYIICLELWLSRLGRYAKNARATLEAERRATDFWRQSTKDCQEGRAESHKRTKIMPKS